MKTIVLLSLLCVVYAVPAPSFLDSVSDCNDATKIQDTNQFFRFDKYNSGQGAYRFGFIQPDGTQQEQEGGFVSKGDWSVRGFFSYIGNDGVRYTTKYKADEDGYRPIIEQGPGGSVPDAVVASMLGG